MKESTVTIKCSPDLDFRAGLFIRWLGIFHINKQSGSNNTFTSPTPFLEYKIQCLDLESSVFKIHIYDKDKNKIRNCVKGVYLTLIIFDARVQYLHSRKAN